MPMAKERLTPLVCLYDGAGGRYTREAIYEGAGKLRLGYLDGIDEPGSGRSGQLGHIGGMDCGAGGIFPFQRHDKNSELFVAGPPVVNRALGSMLTNTNWGIIVYMRIRAGSSTMWRRTKRMPFVRTNGSQLPALRMYGGVRPVRHGRRSDPP
jgi:hypothetical protein